MTPEAVLLRPVMTEKSTRLARFHQYVFAVHRDASKVEIRRAVEAMFKVRVEAVRTVNLKGKRKRRGMRWFTRSAVRRAIVTLAEGAQIDLGAPA